MSRPSIPLPLARVLLHPYYRLTFQRWLPWKVQRLLLDVAARTQPMPPGATTRTLTLGERRAEVVSVGETAGRGAVLYLHGGGYTVGSIATHRSLAAHLARAAARSVYLLDYRLAPEHRCPAPVHDAVAAFDALGRAGHAPGTIALAGDSAGGGIALAAAQAIAARGGEQPAALVLLSPWANPAKRASRHRDLVVNRPWGFACADAYRGDGDPVDPVYAPQLGPMAGLPPTYLHAGLREMLYDQCLELAVLLRRAGIPLRYVESPDLWHAGQVQAGLVRAAADSLSDVGAYLRRAFDTFEPIVS